MIREMLKDAAIGRSVRSAAEGILMQQRFSGATILGVVDWSTEVGDFEFVVRKKGEGDGSR